MSFFNKKYLYIVLAMLIISICTLSIVYAALSVTLSIVGNAEVVASSWDIKFSSPKVKSGSVSVNVPTLNGNTLNFLTTLNIPGDYYEFTVDVVNNGTIDAVVENVLKTPELTSEQAKYFNYEITYENGMAINSLQNLKAGNKVRLKVRVEYRNDLVASELPTSTVNLSLGATLIYSQSNGNGTDVENGGLEGITFTLEGNSYTIFEEMTWEEWLNTPEGISSGVYVENYYLCGTNFNKLIYNSTNVLTDPNSYIYSDDFDEGSGACK